LLRRFRSVASQEIGALFQPSVVDVGPVSVECPLEPGLETHALFLASLLGAPLRAAS
jgi:hypothetical protein